MQSFLKERVIMMEDHNAAYWAWRDAGLRDKILVHIDAHIDFAWIRDRDPMSILEAKGLKEIEEMLKDRSSWNITGRGKNELLDIGNYIYPAIRDGIVREFYWVVPDPIWEDPKERKAIIENLKNILRSVPSGAKGTLKTKDGLIRAKIDNIDIITCSLSRLPEFQEKVLLDIDVDFLVTDSISVRIFRDNRKKIIPWMWPEELVVLLREKNIESELTTIAYSVEGGFTPLEYKYLGDVIRDLLEEPYPGETLKELMRRKKLASVCAHSGRYDEALYEFRETLKLKPDDATIHYNLALLFYDKKAYGEARDAYRRAVTIDPAYKTEYNNYGSAYLVMGLRRKAEDEYRKALTFDPQSAHVYRGLGNVYAADHRWRDAASNYKRSIELNGKCHKALYNLAYVLSKMARFDEAIKELKESLRIKPDEGKAHRLLGYLYTKKGRSREAIGAYKASLRLGYYRAATHLKLSWLYLRKEKRYKAAEELRAWVRLFPKEVSLSLPRLMRNFLRDCARRVVDVKAG